MTACLQLAKTDEGAYETAIDLFRQLLIQLRDIVVSIFSAANEAFLASLFGSPSPALASSSPITQLIKNCTYFPHHPVVRTVKRVLLPNERQ